jgi:hypothetical protein
LVVFNAKREAERPTPPKPLAFGGALVLKCGGRPPPVAKMGVASHPSFFFFFDLFLIFYIKNKNVESLNV